jgi:hypothetical protein
VIDVDELDALNGDISSDLFDVPARSALRIKDATGFLGPLHQLKERSLTLKPGWDAAGMDSVILRKCREAKCQDSTSCH